MTDTPDFAALPSRPDPDTGEPFPPHGLAWHGRDRNPEDNPNRETRLSHKPEPPPEKGPVLAWHKEGGRGKISGFFWSIAIISIGSTIVSLINGEPPLLWARLWQVWIAVIIFSLLMTRPLTYVSMSAGADWVQCQVVRFGVVVRKKHLDLYQLRKIKVTTGPAALYLELADESDSIDLSRVYWQSDRRLWDLVYNGVLHSVAAGAEVNRNAQGFLELARVPELRHPEGSRQIDVTKLSDLHVWELMEDPVVRSMCNSIQFEGSAAEFRKLFPEFDEGLLANPANPEWFATGQDQDRA